MVTLHADIVGPIRAAVVGPHPVFRVGITQALIQMGGCVVLAEGASAEDATSIARQHAPEIIVLDLDADFSHAAVRRLATEFPAVHILILTAPVDEYRVMAALRAGAAGYLFKTTSALELLQSVRCLHRGESYVDSGVAARLIRHAYGLAMKPALLSAREHEILRLLARGLTNKEIARNLDLSDKTIKQNLTQMFIKLEVRNRTEAALLGRRTSPFSPFELTHIH